jgi:Brp/Blh family beta-carotene 15,15'-monooxygenase
MSSSYVDAVGRFGTSDPEGTARTASRAALVVLTAGFAVARLAGFGLGLRAQAAVYLVGMVALNLPHGGYEHFANLRRRVGQFRLAYLAAYLSMVGAAVGLFLLAPVVGLALFVAVAIAKGGLGDLHVLAATSGTDHIRTRPQRWLAAAARGGAVMAVPIVAFPETFSAFSGLIVGLVEPGALGAVRPYFDVTGPLIGVGYGAVVLAHLGLGFARRDGSGSWVADAVETLLLVVYFAVVPVVVAVGLYFPVWYSTRQVARELAVDDEPAAGGDLLGSPDASAGHVALRAWLVLMVGALATAGVAAVLWWVTPQPLGGANPLLGGVAFWTAFISIIALPHVVVGGVLDQARGIWHVP